MLIVMKKPGNNYGGMMAILESNHLIDYYPILLFYTPQKLQKTYGFLMFSGGIKRKHWAIDWRVRLLPPIQITESNTEAYLLPCQTSMIELFAGLTPS